MKTLRFVALLALCVACDRPPVETTQMGFRGLGIENVQNPRTLEALLEANQAPASLPPVSTEGPKASEVYKNVQVLGNVSATEFGRLMAAITSWVSPQQSCNYCHVDGDLASDAKYTKVVARRMIQMTEYINGNWKDHVRDVGVTCYTCHRGEPLPVNLWSMAPSPTRLAGFLGAKAGQNFPASTVGLTSLPYDPFSPLLAGDGEIRVQSETALPTGDESSIQKTERTYGLMIHVSEALGVNCTYCHNTRSFMPWEASSPARVNAWYAIRMVRHLNNDYVGSLASVFPANRKGPMGDVLKVNCATCHQGLPKPLNGASMLKDYPELAGGTTGQ